jgi:hypothetical protein
MVAMGDSWVRLQAVSVFGSAAEGLLLAAIPLLAVSLTTDPLQVSLVSVAGESPWLLFSLFAGLLIDRVRRTAVLTAAYAVQCLAAVAIGVAATGGWLSLPLLMTVAFLVTASRVLEDGATGALVPDLVAPDRLAAANTRLIVIDRGVVQFVVPPVTGTLLGFAAGLPAWGACVMAAGACVLTRRIRSTATVPPRGSSVRRDLAEGLAYLMATPLLRAITITVGLGSFAASAALAMLVLFATQVLGLGPVGYGGLLACLASGWVAASFVAGRVVGRLGYSWSMRISQTGGALITLAIAIRPPRPVLVGALLVGLTAFTLVWNICSQSVRQRFTPSDLLGRVLTSHRALAWGLAPLGALTGGFVAAEWSLRGVYVLAFAFDAAATAVVWRHLTPDAFARAEAELRGAGAQSRGGERMIDPR